MPAKIVLAVWTVFSLAYVLHGEYNRLQNFVAKNAFNQGISTAAQKIISETQKCQPVPIVADEQRVEIINIQCLQQQNTEAAE